MRRMRATINSDYVQPLKLRISDRMIVAMSNMYNSILLRNTHRAPDSSAYDLSLWAKFDSDDFDGIQIHTALSSNGSVKSIASAVFDIYSVAANGWTETFLHQATGSLGPSKSFVASVSQSSLAPILDGEITLAIYATVTRSGKVYKNKIYVNHLGSYDSIVRLRNKVKFLDIIKKDG